MKKKLVVLIILTMIILCSCGTKAESEVKNQPKEEIVNMDISSTDYGMEIYESDYVNIVCNTIYSDRIEFDVTSKLENNSISVLVDSVALDGKVPKEYYGGEDNWLDIEPGKTVTLNYYAYINSTDHKKMTACFEVFNDEGGGAESVDIVEFDLGGTEHEEYDEPDGTLLYDSLTLSILYAGADDTGIRLRVHNKMNYSTTIAFDTPFIINEKECDEIVTVLTLPAYSIRDYYFYVKQFDADYVPEKIESFACSGHTYANEKFKIDSEKAVEPTNADSYEDVVGNEPFIAQGDISLFSFLENASNNGYELNNPDRDGNYVNAEAQGKEDTFDITYLVKDQHIYEVVINDVTMENKYFDLICAMAKAINPNVDEEVLVNAVETAYIFENEEILMGDMLFEFDIDERTFKVAY